MNVGLSNLSSLKAVLLAKSMQSNTDYDAKISMIGLGVAAAFDSYCNRKFAYDANYEEIFSGDRPHWYASRSPIATNPDGSPQIAAVNMRYFMADAWTDIEGEPIQCNPKSGQIAFGYTLGRAPLQVQIIYTGGHFFETLEPTDPGYPSAVPAGAAVLPADILSAFMFQCAEVWNKFDKLGANIAANPDTVTKTGELDLIPLVKTILRQRRRMMLT